jgi:catechol 2,3-dioxygenase-like lactoylglutathione lyase family enzyme
MRLVLLFAFFGAVLLGQVARPNAAGVAMGHLHIVSPNPEAHKRFWIDVLGGKLVKVGPLDFAMFPGVLVGFRKGDSSGGTDGSVVDHLGFLVPDLAATKAKLTAAGAQIVREMPATRQMFVMLPDGVKVEFSEDAAMDAPIRHHHIHFASHELEQMRAWYAKVFGAVPGVRGKFQAADLPGVNLSWNPAEKPPLPTRGRALDHIGFEVTDIKAFCAKLQAAGISLEMPPTSRPDLGLTIAFVTDPWGTRIELTEGLSRISGESR